MGRSLMEMPVLEIEQKLNKYLQAIQLQLITGETPSPSLSTYVLISHLATKAPNHPPPHNPQPTPNCCRIEHVGNIETSFQGLSQSSKLSFCRQDRPYKHNVPTCCN